MSPPGTSECTSNKNRKCSSSEEKGAGWHRFNAECWMMPYKDRKMPLVLLKNIVCVFVFFLFFNHMAGDGELYGPTNMSISMWIIWLGSHGCCFDYMAFPEPHFTQGKFGWKNFELVWEKSLECFFTNTSILCQRKTTFGCPKKITVLQIGGDVTTEMSGSLRRRLVTKQSRSLKTPGQKIFVDAVTIVRNISLRLTPSFIRSH